VESKACLGGETEMGKCMVRGAEAQMGKRMVRGAESQMGKRSVREENQRWENSYICKGRREPDGKTLG
jgi:hypothetical protein